MQDHQGPICEENVLPNPLRTVLGVSVYRAQTTMLVDCLNAIWKFLPIHTKEIIIQRGSSIVATSVALQWSSVLDAVVVLPAGVGGYTKFGADARKFVNMSTRRARCVSVLMHEGMFP